MPYSFSGVLGCRKSCSEVVREGLLSFILLLFLLVSLVIIVESTLFFIIYGIVCTFQIYLFVENYCYSLAFRFNWHTVSQSVMRTCIMVVLFR